MDSSGIPTRLRRAATYSAVIELILHVLVKFGIDARRILRLRNKCVQFLGDVEVVQIRLQNERLRRLQYAFGASGRSDQQFVYFFPQTWYPIETHWYGRSRHF